MGACMLLVLESGPEAGGREGGHHAFPDQSKEFTVVQNRFHRPVLSRHRRKDWSFRCRASHRLLYISFLGDNCLGPTLQLPAGG